MRVQPLSIRGLPVHPLPVLHAVRLVQHWIAQYPTHRETRCVAFLALHVLHMAESIPALRRALQAADLVLPDGMPIVWALRQKGVHLKQRTSGPDFMPAFFHTTGGRYRHYLYGGPPGLAQTLAHQLQKQYGAQIVGTYSPPFRPLTVTEKARVIDDINRARPHVVWVGLGAPKQELWMNEFRHALDVPVLVAVGAAFDFLAGWKKRAPAWMQHMGLEWVFRLITEPRRLWKRYMTAGWFFLRWYFAERFDPDPHPQRIQPSWEGQES